MADVANKPPFHGPVDYTEVVYAMHSYSIAEQIMQDVRDGKAVHPDAVAWASRFQFLPHVNVDITGSITESFLPDADSY